ncbi:hypothetical protein U2167_17520, partial [Listeria monocytogenes]
YSYRHVIGEHSQYTYSRAIIDFILTEIKKNPQKTIEHLKKKTKKYARNKHLNRCHHVRASKHNVMRHIHQLHGQ